MEKQEIVYIYQKPILLNLTITTHTAHTFSYIGGQINVSVSPYYNLDAITKSIEKAIPYRTIEKFVSEPYVGKDYIDVTGIRHHLVILDEGGIREKMDDYIFSSRKKIRFEMRKIAYEVYLQEIRKWEKIMNIVRPHSLKVTNMRSCVGKHYLQKNLITLDEDLIHYSIEIIDSVVIHELCHYFYQDHSERFYTLLLKYCPNYKIIKKKLMYGERR